MTEENQTFSKLEEENNSLDDISLPNELDMRVTKTHVKILLDAAENVLQGRNLTKGNIIRVTYVLMRAGDKMKKTKGIVKKYALLAALDMLIAKNNTINQEEKDMLFTMVHDVVSQTIDARHLDKNNNSNNLCCIIL